jgi:hypothetical protein
VAIAPPLVLMVIAQVEHVLPLPRVLLTSLLVNPVVTVVNPRMTALLWQCAHQVTSLVQMPRLVLAIAQFALFILPAQQVSSNVQQALAC